jgi:hypothetical protein
MSNREIAHLQDDDLLRLLDGELPDRHAARLRSHAQSCWTCRTRLEEFERTIGEYVRYREGMKPILPPPPKPWADLEMPAVPFPSRAFPSRARKQAFFGLRLSHWLAAAACLIVAFFLMRRFERVPEVSAAELLRKATAAQDTLPNHRLYVKTSHRSFTRPAFATTVASDDANLKEMFDAARFSWDDPLSARSFASWRDQLRQKSDKVEEVDNNYVIRTTTSASSLRQATLTLRVRDLRPLREMLEFTSDTVEISDATPEDVAGTPSSPAPDAGRVTTVPPLPTTPNIAMSPALRELQVFSALHRIGADLGEPVEIHESGGRLSVIGTGLTAARKEQLRAALSEIPGVEVRFDDAKASAGAIPTPSDRAAPATAPMQIRLQALLGSRESAEDFTNRALDASDAVMARVHALRAIARAFQPAVESGLAAPGRATLTTLRDDHRAVLSQRIADLDRVLKPVLSTGAPVPTSEPRLSEPRSPLSEPRSPLSEPRPPGSGPTWQDTAQALFTAAQRLDRLLNAALAGPNASGDDSDLAKLAAALGSLQAQFAIYEKASR